MRIYNFTLGKWEDDDEKNKKYGVTKHADGTMTIGGGGGNAVPASVWKTDPAYKNAREAIQSGKIAEFNSTQARAGYNARTFALSKPILPTEFHKLETAQRPERQAPQTDLRAMNAGVLTAQPKRVGQPSPMELAMQKRQAYQTQTRQPTQPVTTKPLLPTSFPQEPKKLDGIYALRGVPGLPTKFGPASSYLTGGAEVQKGPASSYGAAGSFTPEQIAAAKRRQQAQDDYRRAVAAFQNYSIDDFLKKPGAFTEAEKEAAGKTLAAMEQVYGPQIRKYQGSPRDGMGAQVLPDELKIMQAKMEALKLKTRASEAALFGALDSATMGISDKLERETDAKTLAGYYEPGRVLSPLELANKLILESKGGKSSFGVAKEQSPLAYSAAKFGAEGVKYALGAKAFEAVPLAGKLAEQAGTGLSKLTGGKIGAQVMTRLAEGRVTDLPFDIVNAALEADSPETFAKSLLGDQAMGLAADVGMEGIAAGWRAIRGNFTKAGRLEKLMDPKNIQDADIDAYLEKRGGASRAETFQSDDDYERKLLSVMKEEYKNSADPELRQFAEEALNTSDKNWRNLMNYDLAPVNKHQANDVYRLTGIDVSGYQNNIKGNSISHINERHGIDGKHDTSMADVNDIARLGYALEHYDSVEKLLNSDGTPVKSKEFMNKDNTPADVLRYTKRINGTLYIIEAVPDTKAKKMRVITAYISPTKKGAEQVLYMPEGPQLTSKTPLASVPASSIPPQTLDFNGQNGGNFEGRIDGPLIEAAEKARAAQEAAINAPMEDALAIKAKMENAPGLPVDGLPGQKKRKVPFSEMFTDADVPPPRGSKQFTEDFDTPTPFDDLEVENNFRLGVDPEEEKELRAMGTLTGKGVSYFKDPARNFDAAAGGDKETREWLSENIEKPWLEAKKQYTANIKKDLNDLETEIVDKGIKPKSKESAAVQWFGEGVRRDKYGNDHPYTLQMLKEEFPDEWKDIVRADAKFRKMYNDFFQRQNDSLKEIYPYADAEAAMQIDRLTDQALGAGIRMQAAQEAIAGGGLNPLEEAEELNVIDQARKRIRGCDMQIAQLEKAIETGDSVRGKRLPYRDDYYHHFKEMEQGFGGLKNILSTPADIDPKLVGVSDNTKPKSRWAGFMQRRNGADYEADAVGGMLKYIPMAEYKINMDGVIAKNRDIIKQIQEATADSKNANDFVEWLTDWTNDMAGKTNPIDRAAQKLTNRKTMAAVNWLNGRVKSNAVLGNLNSAVSQIFNLPNAAGYIKNPVHMAQGLGDWAKSLVGNKKINDLLRQSGFMEERYLEKSFKQFDEGILKTPRRFAEWMLNVGDEQSAKWIWFSAYENGKAKGVKDLISYADDITRRSVAGRGIGEIPVFYKSRVVQLVTPFQIEVNNGFQVLKEKIGQKDALGVVEIAVAGWLLNNLGESVTGNRVAFDPINAVQEALQGADEEADTVSKAVAVGSRLGGEVISSMPGGTFIGSLIIPDENQRQAIFGDSDPSRFGTGNIGIDAFTQPFRDVVYNFNQKRNGSDSRRNPDWVQWGLTWGLPFGGKQVDRTLKAAQDLGWVPRRGDAGKIAPDMPASYSQTGRFRFALDPLSLAKKAQALAFGSFATPEGQAYL